MRALVRGLITITVVLSSGRAVGGGAQDCVCTLYTDHKPQLHTQAAIIGSENHKKRASHRPDWKHVSIGDTHCPEGIICNTIAESRAGDDRRQTDRWTKRQQDVYGGYTHTPFSCSFSFSRDRWDKPFIDGYSYLQFPRTSRPKRGSVHSINIKLKTCISQYFLLTFCSSYLI